jgi:hypothetical protein
MLFPRPNEALIQESIPTVSKALRNLFIVRKMKIKVQTGRKVTKCSHIFLDSVSLRLMFSCYIGPEDSKSCSQQFALLSSFGVLTNLLNRTCSYLGCFT